MYLLHLLALPPGVAISAGGIANLFCDTGNVAESAFRELEATGFLKRATGERPGGGPYTIWSPQYDPIFFNGAGPTESEILNPAPQPEPVRTEGGRKVIPTSVYLMVNNDGLIKIGFSRSPAARLSAIRVGLPHVSLLCHTRLPSIGDASNLEQALHAMFAHARVVGEWFRLTENELEQATAELKKAGAFTSLTQPA